MFLFQFQDFHFLCPNDTVFDQQHLVCTNWFEVDCYAQIEVSIISTSSDCFQQEFQVFEEAFISHYSTNLNLIFPLYSIHAILSIIHMNDILSIMLRILVKHICIKILLMSFALDSVQCRILGRFL